MNITRDTNTEGGALRLRRRAGIVIAAVALTMSACGTGGEAGRGGYPDQNRGQGSSVMGGQYYPDGCYSNPSIDVSVCGGVVWAG